uniref:Uncharacterized protein n=1 Tax=Nelumbo nucifera TaxID=4432 RepID=A0A822ZJ43_NELNU|nr:TPA_asm: hypothetical protein HUJ06_001639 [Nelumbo nucifera]
MILFSIGTLLASPVGLPVLQGAIMKYGRAQIKVFYDPEKFEDFMILKFYKAHEVISKGNTQLK